MKYLRLLLLPLSLIYGIVVLLRNWCYNAGLFKSQSFNLPVISVGNLDVGGAGKTPMTEYLVRLLHHNHRLATLSRGYGRQTTGFLIATSASTANDIGDEPAQFKAKFSDITVAVCEDRVTGINNLKASHNLIILDDAYQHRAVKPGFSVLLFDFNSLGQPQLLLPAGNRREPFAGRKRADLMIVTKCPADLAIAAQHNITKRLQPFKGQSVFFTGIDYYPLQNLQEEGIGITIDSHTTVFLITGIANPKPLVKHIGAQTAQLIHHNYPDHHQFSLKNIAKLAEEFNACTAQKKVVVTTEKDAQRLKGQELMPLLIKLPVFVVPIGIRFLNNDEPQFNQLITNYVRQYQ